MVCRVFMYFRSFYLILISKSFFCEWVILDWFRVRIKISILFDWISLVFLGSVCLIGSQIIKFCEYYIHGDNNYLRFIFILLIFIRSIILLIISPNLISMLLGWDGLGYSSYILVAYYQNERSCNSAILTVLRNRLGDASVLLRVGLLFRCGSWDFYLMENYYRYSVGLIILAAITKRAQIPFSSWLPAAIAAPTPVRALVHSSTLVTAGVYLLIRFSPNFDFVLLKEFLMIVGVITMFIAGLGANYESDLKKIIALSTLSQLGLMIMTIGLGLPVLAFFHLIIHAIFKSVLFMCIGVLIHITSGNQDRRFFRSLGLRRPVIRLVMVVRNISLCGLPFIRGFYSKDPALERVFRNNSSNVLILLVVISTAFTISYSLRLIYLRSYRVRRSLSLRSLESASVRLIKSFILLYFFSVSIGLIIYWFFLLVPPSLRLFYLDKYLIFITMLLRGLIRFIRFNKNNVFTYKVLYYWLRLMWFLGYVRVKYVSKPYLYIGFISNKLIDMGWLEYFGATGGEFFMLSMSSTLQKAQVSLIVSRYLLVGFIRLRLFLIIYLSWCNEHIKIWSLK